jgi:hypothetical protein
MQMMVWRNNIEDGHLLGRQPISTKSVDPSQYIKNRSMGAAYDGLWDLRRQTNLQKTPLQYGEK